MVSLFLVVVGMEMACNVGERKKNWRRRFLATSSRSRWPARRRPRRRWRRRRRWRCWATGASTPCASSSKRSRTTWTCWAPSAAATWSPCRPSSTTTSASASFSASRCVQVVVVNVVEDLLVSFFSFLLFFVSLLVFTEFLIMFLE